MRNNRKKAAKRIKASEVEFTQDSVSVKHPDVFVSNKNAEIVRYLVHKEETSCIGINLYYSEDESNWDFEWITAPPQWEDDNSDKEVTQYALNLFSPDSPNDYQTGYHEIVPGLIAFVCFPN